MINFLRTISFQICVPLAHIFNLSVQNGIFPENMKTSRTIPVFKKSGSPLEMNNCRPIAIINAFSKIFEKIISNGKHLNIYNIGTTEKIKINNLTKLIAKIMLKKVVLKKGKLKKGGTPIRCPNINKIKSCYFYRLF